MKELISQLEKIGLDMDWCLHTGGCYGEVELAEVSVEIAGLVKDMSETQGIMDAHAVAMKFYEVTTLDELIEAQSLHIERLQAQRKQETERVLPANPRGF
jgi:hypothetical protein